MPRRHVSAFLRLLGAVLLLVASLPLATAATATETESISAQALTSHSCDDSEWHFVITGLDDADSAPASISVSWDTGASATVALEGVTGGTAHYRTTANLDATVTAATAQIDSGWSGQFNLSHGPCDTSEGDGGGGSGESDGVTAVAPKVTESCEDNEAVVTITATEHVTYRLNGSVVAAGDHVVAADGSGHYSVVVKAEAESGFTLEGKVRWDLSGTLDCDTAGGGGNTSGTIFAKALADHECNDSEWHFVITQLESDAQAPASITVTFTGGVTLVVDLDKVTGGTAHYRTTEHLDLAVTSASASITGEWSGQFNLSHGPCGDTSGEQPTDVTAAAPTVVYDCTTKAVLVTIKDTANVSYAINGQAAAAGTHSIPVNADGTFSITVTATAKAGFALKGEDTFSFIGTLKCDTPPPTPGSPTVSVSQQPCTAGGASEAVVHVVVAAGSTTAPYTVTKSVGGAAATTVATVNLPNGATNMADVGVALVEDTAVRIVVSTGTTTLADVTLTANCTAPGVTPTPPTGGGTTGGAGGSTGSGADVSAGGAVAGGGAGTGGTEDTEVRGSKFGQTPTGTSGGGLLAATGALLPIPALVGLGGLLLLAGLVLVSVPRRLGSLLAHGKHRR